MKKFSQLDKVNESAHLHQRDEIEFLLSTLNLSIEDLEDIFIGVLDKGDHNFGINLLYNAAFTYNIHKNLSFTMVNKEDLRSDFITEIKMTIYFQSKTYNSKSYYSNKTKEKGLYSKNEIDLMDEYIIGLKRLSSMIKTDNLSFNTRIEQLNINIEFENSDEILNGLKKLK